MDAAREALAELLFDRVAADPALPNDAGELVLAAFDGTPQLDQTLAGALGDRPIPSRDRPEPTPVPGICLRSISVAGFRGIGPKAQLDLRPGPGLTIVTGRNGSGKSSFAEAAELALTGQNRRWSERTNTVWRSGWRNLHQRTGTALGVELVVEGAAKPMMVARTWADDAELDDAVATAQVHGQPRTSLADLGWDQALSTYRPFLPYAELGAVTEGRPSDLYEAIQSMLGLELLVDAEKRLSDAKKRLEDRAGVAKKPLLVLKTAVAASADSRADRVGVLLGKRSPDIDAIAAIATGVEVASEDAALDALLALRSPDVVEVTAAASELRAGLDAVAAETGTQAGRSRELAGLLRAALAHHDRTGDSDCPVCGTGELDIHWHERTVHEVGRLEAEAAAAVEAGHQLEQAIHTARNLIRPVPAVLLRSGVAGIDVDEALSAWTSWAELADRTPVEMTDSLVTAATRLEQAVAPVVAGAARIEQEQDRSWQPLAEQVLSWVELARSAAAAAPTAALVKTACTWLKDAGHALREERLAPFAGQSTAIWEQLRQESNVTLGTLKLEGTATRRRVSVDVTVDGSEIDALGVMSQGELRALGLALFLPRATAAASPFRFVVIDDPVQAMDPAKVDGLARVLASVAETRQVVVFTHDDRLPESVRRLQLDAIVLQVTRRAQSEVALRVVRDPVSRYLDDARAVANTRELPADVAGVVVASLCRGAVEAACHERVRARRLGAGQSHDDVEALLDRAQTTNELMCLALFDDPLRGADVLPRLNGLGRPLANAFQAVKKGAHVGHFGSMSTLVSDTEKLIARALR